MDRAAALDIWTLSTRPAVDLLIAEVQAKFNAGQEAYQAGHLVAARKDFNFAVDRLMKSGLESTGDPRLQDLFNTIVDTMQQYEVEAEKQDEEDAESETDQEQDQGGENDAQAQEESSAPIDEIANMESLPATDPRLAAMAEKELLTVSHDIPITVNAAVLQYLSFFETPRGRDIVEQGLQRAGRYRAMIESVLKKEGLPQDLIYLAQAESAFKSRAYSRMGAGGIWQFMPFRGEEYGLDRNYYVDERYDPLQATRAAAEHLRDLYGMFGDWYLVMAAYNSGPLSVARAIERTGYADFWELKKRNALPLQTKNYVPIILALTLIAKDPALYGIQVTPDPPITYDTVHLDHAISLRLVADATGSNYDDVQQLNPELIRGITPNTPGFALHVPPGTANSLQKELAVIPPSKWTSWRLAKLEPGDTLESLARHYHVTMASIEKANGVNVEDPPAEGATLIIPANRPRARMFYYRIRRGDTLDSIAARHRVSVEELRRWNHIRGSYLRAGHLLRIYEVDYSVGRRVRSTSRWRRSSRKMSAAKVQNASDHSRFEHRVRSGETLWSIARAYRTTVTALKRANPFLADRELQAGDILTILQH